MRRCSAPCRFLRCPGKRRRVPVLARVGELKPERVDPRGGRLSHGQRRVGRIENSRDLRNLALRGLRRYKVFYLDLRKLAYSHPVATALVLVLYGCYLHPEVLSDK